MVDTNRIISARQQFLNPDGTVAWQWYRYLENLSATDGDDTVLIEGEILTRATVAQTPNSKGIAEDAVLLAAMRQSSATKADDGLGMLLATQGSRGPQGAQGADGADGMIPYYIAPDETFTIPLYRQATYAMTIDNEGILDIEGYLILVD